MQASLDVGSVPHSTDGKKIDGRREAGLEC